MKLGIFTLQLALFGWLWLVLIYCERKVLLVGWCWFDVIGSQQNTRQICLTFRAISVTSIILKLLGASTFHVIITILPLSSWQSFSQISKLISQLSLVQQGEVRPPDSDRRHVSPSPYAAALGHRRYIMVRHFNIKLTSVNWCQRRG